MKSSEKMLTFEEINGSIPCAVSDDSVKHIVKLARQGMMPIPEAVGYDEVRRGEIKWSSSRPEIERENVVFYAGVQWTQDWVEAQPIEQALSAVELLRVSEFIINLPELSKTAILELADRLSKLEERK